MSWLRVLLFPLVGVAVAAARPDIFTPKDFTEYWSAAAVFARGGDPYDGGQLLPVQQTITGDHNTTKAVSLWTPPWTLPLYLPFGFLPFAAARFVWLFAQLTMLFAAVELLWRTYSCSARSASGLPEPARGASRALDVLPHLLAAAFAPTFWMTEFGQNTAFLLLGLAGFLRFRESRPVIAGCFAALTAIKPHLLAVFGVLLVLDVFRRDGWKVLAAGVGVLAVGSLLSLALNAHIFEQFAAAVRRPATPETVPLSEWDLPLIAHKLRHAIDPHRFGIQFVPCAVACGLMAVHKLWQGNRWDWKTQLPPAVLVTCLYAPYGGWMFDLVVLLVPVIHAAALLSPPPSRSGFAGIVLALGYLLVSLFGFLISRLAEPLWFTPAVAGLYVAAVSAELRWAKWASWCGIGRRHEPSGTDPNGHAFHNFRSSVR